MSPTWTVARTEADAEKLGDAIKEVGYTPVAVEQDVEGTAANASPVRGGCCCG